MDVAITKMSSKGQVVIPSEMRKEIKEGDKLLIIKNNGQLIMKKASYLDKNLIEDIKFARETEKSWQDYEKGNFKKMNAKKFLKEIEKW
ncbi:MAG: AbrB/MazE/SpoVT family DNA-binding domain-containing protein [Candidatus Nanoarchaeia archaeon]|nr:AbrB/MazE/SpoVT family DNA-binding domain-containing protein [Candidatus Nanoarchaeia archaeon]MDD5054067.1 AbrB/MazE/SpoVT family DNA-binding domain-containing protein [Candidatus Nanoarchaeia archaeon]